MVHFTEVNGVIFCEQNLPGEVVGPISIKAPSQNSTLAELKVEMANRAKAMGGDAIVNFKYGQKADKGMSLFNPFKWDTERQTGSGDVVKLQERPTA